MVINKSDGGVGDRAVADWCAQEEIEILARIPHSEAFATDYAEGRLSAEYRDIAAAIWANLLTKGGSQ